MTSKHQAAREILTLANSLERFAAKPRGLNRIGRYRFPSLEFITEANRHQRKLNFKEFLTRIF